MARTPKYPAGKPGTTLPPTSVTAVVLAALGLWIVLAPEEPVRAIGLLSMRRAYDHAFAIVVLLVTAWASWEIAAQMGRFHARGQFLKTVAAAFDSLSPMEQLCVLDCLRSPDLTMRRRYHDPTALSACDIGLLQPPSGESDLRSWIAVTFTMAPDVAEVLQCHVKIEAATEPRGWTRPRTLPEGRVAAGPHG